MATKRSSAAMLHKQFGKQAQHSSSTCINEGKIEARTQEACQEGSTVRRRRKDEKGKTRGRSAVLHEFFSIPSHERTRAVRAMVTDPGSQVTSYGAHRFQST